MKRTRLAAGMLVGSLGLLAPDAGLAQITNTSDESPPPVGSLRREVEDSRPGEVLDVRIGEVGSTSGIELNDTLVFDNDVEIDNSSEDTGFVEVIAPGSDLFLDIDPGVDVVFRDVELVGLGSTNDDDIEIGTGGSLTLDVERQDQRLSVDVTGAGALVKEGSATLELSGDNTFSGGLTVVDGDLVGDPGTFGTGAISLAPNRSSRTARLVFRFSGTEVLVAPIVDNSSSGGEAGIVKRGSGSLDVSGATISGSLDFEIEDGELVIGNANLANGHDYEIGEDGALQIVISSGVSSSSVFSGEGTIETVANAVDPLVLTGDPSGFTGQLDVTLGTAASSTVRLAPAAAPAGGLAFSVDLEAGTTFELQDDFALGYAGNVTGAGTFAKSGAGRTTLSGSHVHTGGTNVLGGTLIGSTANLPGDVALAPGTTLVFSQGSSATYSGTLRDTGGAATIRKTGAGTLTLTASSPVAGLFAVEAGGLRLAAGSGLPGVDLTVGTGLAGGSATLSADFDPAAAAGAAVNAYSVGGDLTFASDATLSVGLADTTNVNTRIVAGGNVVVDPGARLAVQTVQGGTYDTSLTWDVLTGASIAPATGPLFDIEQTLYFFTIEGAVVGGNTYRLSLTDSGNTLAEAATTSNQAVIGAQLDVFRTAPVVPAIEPEIAAYQAAITSLTADEVTGVLDAVSPDDLAAGTPLALAGAARTYRGLSDRLALLRRGWVGRPDPVAERPARRRPSVQAGPSVSGTSTGPAEGDRGAAVGDRAEADWQAWLEGQAIFGEIDSSDAKDIEYVSGGPVLGADRRLGDDVRVGFALSGGGSSYDSGSGDGDGGSVEGTLYAAWLGEPMQVIGAARYARAWLDTERKLVAGTASDDISGDLDGDVFGGYLELTGSVSPWLARAGTPMRGIDVSPLASVGWTRVSWDAFDEGGSSPLAVQVDEQEIDSVQTSLGLRISAQRRMEEGVLIRPRFKLLWNHEWADVEREVSGSFVSAPTTGTTPFTVEGAEMPRDHAELGLGWEVGFTANANLFLDWQGRFGEDFVENALSIGGRVVW
jgi:autotransporter-associated beta strand protein